MQQQDAWDGFGKGMHLPLVSEVGLPFSLSQLVNTGPSVSNVDEDWLTQFTRTSHGPADVGDAGAVGHPPVFSAAPQLQAPTVRLQPHSATQQYAGHSGLLLSAAQAMFAAPPGVPQGPAATGPQVHMSNRVVITSQPVQHQPQPQNLEQQVHQLSEVLSHATVEDNEPSPAPATTQAAHVSRDPSPARIISAVQPAPTMPDPLAQLTYLNNLSKRQRSERSVLTFEEYEAQYGPSLRCATGPCADTCSTPCKAHLCKCCKLHRRVENTGGSRGKGYCGRCARRERVQGMEFVKCSHESIADGKPVRCGVEMLREVFDNHWKQHKSELPPQFEELEIDEGRSCHACTNMRPYTFYPNQDTNCSCNHCQVVKSRGNKTTTRDASKAEDSGAPTSSRQRRVSRGPSISTPTAFPAPSSTPTASAVDNTFAVTSHPLSPAAYTLRPGVANGQNEDPFAATSQPTPTHHNDTSNGNPTAMFSLVNKPAPLMVPGTPKGGLYGDGMFFTQQHNLAPAAPGPASNDVQNTNTNALPTGMHVQQPSFTLAGLVTTPDGQLSPPAVHPLQTEEQLATQTHQLLSTALGIIQSAAPSFHILMHKLRYVHSPPGSQQANSRQALLQQLLHTCNSIQQEVHQISQGVGFHVPS